MKGTKELTDLRADYSQQIEDCNIRIEAVGVRKADIDERLRVIREEKKQCESELAELESRREHLTELLAGVEAELQAAVSDEEFVKALDELVSDYLATKSLKELEAIEDRLASFRPVDTGFAPVEDGVEDDQVPWVSGSDVPTSPAVPAHVAEPMYRLPLADLKGVGSLFKKLGKNLDSYDVSFEIDGCEYVFDTNIINMIDGKKVGTYIEAIRALYVKAFIEWMRKTGVDMSAESVLDRLIGVQYTVQNGKIVPVHTGGGQIVYYRLEDSRGTVLKESGNSDLLGKAYCVYKDENNNSIIVGAMACVTYLNVIKSAFSCYTGGASARNRSAECASIVFDDIFKDVYVACKRREQ